MPERRAALERLCRRFGIATDYHDIWGTRHAVPDENLVALLSAFDVDAASVSAMLAAERSAEAALWRRALPPVVALAADDAQWSLALRLPASAGPLRWTLTEEGGARHAGAAEPASLPVIAQADQDGQTWREHRLAPGIALPAGYHRFTVDGLAGEALLIAAPPRCYRPPALGEDGRIWGPAVQVYALRSEHHWGIGDFGDLARLVEQAAARGADIVGLNPMHALFPHNPAHASPYSPSSRLRLNVLYLDVEGIEDFRECEAAQRRVRSAEFQSRLARLREAEFVDYPGVAAAKFEVLELLHAHFRERHLVPGTVRGEAFRAFQRERGEALHRHAVYEALQAHFHAADASVWGWPKWPAAYHDPASEAVSRFAAEHAERVDYHAYLQWQAERQIGRAAERCRECGLAVGLYLDLAVSVDRAGSDTWAHQACYALGATVGAPPDEFNPAGQAWGLPPLRPDRLRDSGYALFIETLRECMRHAGAVRIDHVMGLMRLFWIPPERSGRDGAYVHYAADELLAIVALESQRNRCMVIGEDLGTVADEMRSMLARFEVLSYRLLYFERGDGGAFKRSADYPRDALVAVSTHDLPTLAGWWTGRDVQLRLELGLYPSREHYERHLVERAQERVRLLLALMHEGLLPEGTSVEQVGAEALTPALVEAIHAFVAATPSRVLVVQMEDVLGVVEQTNMPGTTDQHPNWKRKLPVTLTALAGSERLRSLADVLARIRPHAGPRAAAPRGIEARVPRATYRLQLNKDFTFEHAERMLPYLARLGVSHVYCSPILRARPGSMHGYDIVAHDEINPELGGADGFARFTEALRRHGLGQLIDIVPNHMGVLGADNAWWMDVLENGAASAYARYFDIEWHPVNADLDGKVLVPALGGHYGDVLAGGELVLGFEAESGALALHYHEHRFPLDPRSYPVVLDRAASLLTDADPRDALSSLAAAFGHLPARDANDSGAVAERARDKEVHKARLRELAARNGAIAQVIHATLAQLNVDATHDALHELLEMQAWRLAYWRVASDEINYRRFFDINGLAALRMEDEQVFEATHAFTLELAASGAVDGLRIDHPDGLYDPAQYFRRLQEGYARRVGVPLPEHDAAGRPARPLYVVAEKIVAPHEAVPASWHLHGTTGYRFAMVAGGVLVDGSAQARLDRIWRAFVHEDESFEEMAYLGKRAILRSALASELTMLSTDLLRIARADRRTRDYTFNTLRQALAEIAACMPVYRTYIVDRPSEQDLRYMNWAVAQARRRSRAADVSIFDFTRRSLLGQAVDGAGDDLRSRVRRFAIRFQQFTSPVAAKGVEDTAFYRYSRLVSLNEVGGDPGQFGVTVRAFHGASADRAAHWPHTMLATSTHDNKRSEDVRHRISVLSETPAAWRLALRRWSRINRMHRSTLDDGQAVPSPADEYLLYQTLLGTFPVDGLGDDSLANYRERIQQYVLKAAREAKTHTGWVSPDEAYENGLLGFVGGLLGRLSPNLFLDDLAVQARRLAWFGALNGLTATLLKFTSPGVPDIYQGHELISLALVDPDNRRPVDCDALVAALASLEGLAPAQIGALAAEPHDGRAKLWIAWRLLALRRERPELFRDGDYLALEVHGTHAEHVLAFARRHGDITLIVIAGRLFARLLDEPGRVPVGDELWADTEVAVDLPEGMELNDVLGGERCTVRAGRISLGAAFGRFPAAALITS